MQRKKLRQEIMKEIENTLKTKLEELKSFKILITF